HHDASILLVDEFTRRCITRNDLDDPTLRAKFGGKVDRRVVMGADVVVFASGSAVRSFVEQRLHGPSSRFVALGPSTRHAMVDAGLSVAAMANSPSPRDVVVAVGEAMGRTSP
ncbi:MAG: hypothetical protein ACKOQZ_09785, partial [Actinomycetota bacterium]